MVGVPDLDPSCKDTGLSIRAGEALVGIRDAFRGGNVGGDGT